MREWDADSYRMTLPEHLTELRSTVLRGLIGLAVGVGAAMLFGEQIMQWMCWPLAVAMRANDMQPHLRMLSPSEAFSTYLKVCVIWGLILSAPYALWELWRFIAAGLYPRERKFIRKAVPFSIALFVLGVLFFFLVIAPITLDFFIGFAQQKFPQPGAGSLVLSNRPAHAPAGPTSAPASQPVAAVLPILAADPPAPVEGQIWVRGDDGRVRIFLGGQVRVLEMAPESFLTPDLALGPYVTFVSWLALVFGLGFQVPIVVLGLVRTRLMTLDRLRKGRKYTVLVLLVIAGLLTPPDVASQIALALPMYLLYELGLLLGARSLRRADQESDDLLEDRS